MFNPGAWEEYARAASPGRGAAKSHQWGTLDRILDGPAREAVREHLGEEVLHTPVELHDLPAGVNGQAGVFKNLATGEPGAVIRINAATRRHPERVLSTLLHEARHVWQHRQGWDLNETSRPTMEEYRAFRHEKDAREFADKILGFPVSDSSYPAILYRRGKMQVEEHLRNQLILADLDLPEPARQVVDELRNQLAEEMSGLRRQAPESFAAALQLYNARQIAALLHHFNVPRVREAFRQPDGSLSPEYDRFGIMGVANRALGALDEARADLATWQAEVAAAQAAGDTRAEAEAQAHVDRLKQEIAENAMNRGYSPGAKHPITDPITGHPIYRDDVRDYFAKPEVKAAVAAHNQYVAPILRKMLTDSGATPSNSTGPYADLFMPAIALDENGKEVHTPQQGAGTSGRMGPEAQLHTPEGAARFKASAHSYLTEYSDIIRNRMQANIVPASERALYHRMLDDGVVQPLRLPGVTKEGLPSYAARLAQNNPDVRNDDGHWEINFNGRWEPATPIRYQRAQAWTIAGTVDRSLPDAGVMPTRLYREVRPIVNHEPHVDVIGHGIANSLMLAYLRTMAEAVQHGAAIAGRMGTLRAQIDRATEDRLLSGSPSHIVDKLTRMIPAAEFGKTLGRLLTGQIPEDLLQETLLFAAGSSGLPHAYNPDPLSWKGAAAIANVANAPQNILYGQRGVWAHAATSLYRYVKDNRGWDHGQGTFTPAGARALGEAMRGLNSHMEVLQPRLIKGVRQGVGPLGSFFTGTFYQTGMKNRTVPFYAGVGFLAASLVADQLLKWLLHRGADPDHRWPWQTPGYRNGQVQVGTDTNGNPVTINLNLLSRPHTYVEDLLASPYIEGASNPYLTGKRLGLRYETSAVNWMTGPMVSSPGLGFLSAVSGITPHMVPNDKATAPRLLESRTVKLGAAGRAMAGAQALFPLSAALLGDVTESPAGTGTSIENPRIRAANHMMRLLGAPGFRSRNEGMMERIAQKEYLAERRNEIMNGGGN